MNADQEFKNLGMKPMEEKNIKKTFKLAFLGNTGVGKDTCCHIIQKKFHSLEIKLLKLATPFYAAQNTIYDLCGKEKNPETQDGILLNFLGQHMRFINPNILQESFLKTLNELYREETDLIICPDVRPIDVPFVKKAGFFILHIASDPKITLLRRQKRGDISLGQSIHKTEKGLSPDLYDYQILNNKTLEDFQEKIMKFMEWWMVG
jgi:dephospho-CoA kinase